MDVGDHHGEGERAGRAAPVLVKTICRRGAGALSKN